MRGGRKRADGLTPGSPEAAEADRAKDRERKRREYAAKKALLEPAPLPSADVPAQAPPHVDPVRHDAQLATSAGLAWDQQTLKPLFDQLIPTVEQLTVRQLTQRASQANLPAELVKDIGRDAQWTPPARRAIEIAAPQVAAKWLNKSGLSAEHHAELVLATAIATIAAAQTALLRRLDKLVAERDAREKLSGQTKNPKHSPS